MTEDLTPIDTDRDQWSRSVRSSAHRCRPMELDGTVTRSELPRATVLGLEVSAITFAGAVEAIDGFVRSRHPHLR